MLKILVVHGIRTYKTFPIPLRLNLSRAVLSRAGLLTEVDPAVWRQDWVVHSQAVGDGRASLKYLAPYVFRVAISDRRVVSYDDDSVTFSYRKSGSNRWRRMTLDPPEFLRRFLQHVLPTGFQKVRHYGFLSPNSRVSLDMVRWLIALYQKAVFVLRGQVPHEAAAGPRIRCAHCGGAMLILIRLDSAESNYFDTS
jgi:Putative transposase